MKNNKSENSNGYVYLFKRKGTIDVSGLINDMITIPTVNCNLIDLFVHKSSECGLIELFEQFFKKNNIGLYLDNTIRTFSKLRKHIEIPPLFTDAYLKILDNKNEFDSNLKEISDLIANTGRYSITLDDAQYVDNIDIGIYINLILDYFISIDFIEYYSSKGHTFKIPDIPYFIYKTPYKFDRIRNQEGLFLYQLYYVYSSYQNSRYKLMAQDISPDLTIEILNQDSMLTELDFIGINRKFIFGDFDSTAAYFNERMFT